jgi:hypothetical protein
LRIAARFVIGPAGSGRTRWRLPLAGRMAPTVGRHPNAKKFMPPTAPRSTAATRSRCCRDCGRNQRPYLQRTARPGSGQKYCEPKRLPANPKARLAAKRKTHRALASVAQKQCVSRATRSKPLPESLRLILYVTENDRKQFAQQIKSVRSRFTITRLAR